MHGTMHTLIQSHCCHYTHVNGSQLWMWCSINAFCALNMSVYPLLHRHHFHLAIVGITFSLTVRLPSYLLPHAYQESVKELQEIQEYGTVNPSMSEWASPVVLVKKKDGTLRLCVDYCKLNAVSFSDAYAMPRIDELIDRLGHTKYIKTLDLIRSTPS